MSQRKVSDAILDKFIKQRELTASVKNSWIAGFNPGGKYTARVIIASPEPITVQEAVQIVQETTKGKMNAFAPSFTPIQNSSYPHTFFASIHGYKPMYHVRLADTANMATCHAITATTYLDSELGTIWERKEIGGQQYLIRANEDDPVEVLQTALLASTSVESRVDSSTFLANVKPGNFVLFFACELPKNEGEELKPYMDVAEVKSTDGDAVQVDLEEMGYHATATIHASSVVSVITAQSAALENSKSRREIIDFLKQCYPSDYGAALDSIKNTNIA